MTQNQRLQKLLEELIQEQPEAYQIRIPEDMPSKKRLYRILSNIRKPQPLSDEFIQIQDAYLQEECKHEKITTIDMLRPFLNHLYLWKGDITTLKVDMIVNAANSALLGCFVPEHRCIDNLIHTKSGNQLRLYCKEIIDAQGYPEPVGKAKITPAFNLPSLYIAHTVGPFIQEETTQVDREMLASCYKSCLQAAIQKQCSSIAFCCISTGEFHFPNQEACQIAVQTVCSFLKETQSDINVIFDVFKDIDYKLYKQELERYRNGV